MTKILTVEDSRAQRAIILKALDGRGYVITEAEDGEQGLAKLDDGPVDLILLDITMPVMDGPTMLKELRRRGDKTPVILLTAESKTSIIGEMMREGVDDYILKPFKPEALCSKVDKVLAARPAPVDSSEDSATLAGAGKAFVDVLVVDDMPNVAKRLRRLLPPHMKVEHSPDGQRAVALCREKLFRAVVVDIDIPNVNTATLVSQLRTLQPNAAFLALGLRNVDGKDRLARELGCSGFLVKPFDADEVNDFLSTYFDTHELLTAEDNILRVSEWAGDARRFETAYRRLLTLMAEETDNLAAASFETVVLDLSKVEDSPRVVKFLIKATEHASSMGLESRIVVDAGLSGALKGIKEMESIPMFDDLTAALNADG